MLKQINKEQQEIEVISNALESVYLNVESHSPLLESQTRLNSVVKKILITNKDIPTHLATVVAKTIIFSSLLQELIDRKKRYKKHTLLQKVLDHITDKVATNLEPATVEDVDNVSVDILKITKDVVDSLKGRSTSVEEVQQTFNAIFNKISTNTSERNRINVMKLASRIVQSSKDMKARRDIISQYIE